MIVIGVPVDKNFTIDVRTAAAFVYIEGFTSDKPIS